MNEFLRGDLYYADLNPVIGSEQGGIRPTLIVQNDTGNKFSPTLLIAAITGDHPNHNLPTHIMIKPMGKGYIKILLFCLNRYEPKRIRQYIDHLDDADMREVDEALKISFGLTDSFQFAERDDQL